MQCQQIAGLFVVVWVGVLLLIDCITVVFIGDLVVVVVGCLEIVCFATVVGIFAGTFIDCVVVLVPSLYILSSLCTIHFFSFINFLLHSYFFYAISLPYFLL